MPVSLVALKKVVYAGQTYTSGEVFEARDAADATVLKLTKLAMDQPEPEPEPVPFIITPDPEPAVEEVSVGSPADETAEHPEAPKRRRAYRRRDLQAEE